MTGYRTSSQTGPDPALETEAITELFRRSTALRRRLLLLTLACALLGGAAGAALYGYAAIEVYGRVIGACFAAGGILTFAVLHRLSGLAARRFEARWIAELAGHHQLDPAALGEAMQLFKS